jgi:hypothetical protein
MESKRRLALAISLLAIGLGAGHMVQRDAAKTAALAQRNAEVPTGITNVSAGPDPAPAPVIAAGVAPGAPVLAPEATAQEPALPPADAPELATTSGAETGTAVPALDETPPSPQPAPLSLESTAPPETVTAETAQPEAPVGDLAGSACTPALDLLAQDNAMIGLTLTAPCNLEERVVLRHAGLAVTGRTSATGSLFLSLPALEAQATVSALFADGTLAEAALDLPEISGVSRFAVQWMADDAFQVHAFEDGSDYGMAGHVSAATPRSPLPGVPFAGGFLTLLGDDSVPLPMLAEVYTYPAKADAPVEIVVEAAVTEATCGRDVLGETLTSLGGQVFVTDLTLAMPECDAAGDILVLKNLVPDLKIASTN